MSGIYINAYGAICNLGESIEEIFINALKGDTSFLTKDSNIIRGSEIYCGKINPSALAKIPEIDNEKYNIRCNKILLHCYSQIKTQVQNAIKKYGKDRIGVVIGNTNSGIDKFEKSGDIDHSQIGNPAGFLHDYLGLRGYYSAVSTACTSGIKAFSSAKKLLDSGVCDAVLAGSADALCTIPVYGFHSLEVLSPQKTLPFGKNRSGINIGEGGALFLLEREPRENSVEIKGMGETSDAHHCTTPDPKGIEAIKAIKKALVESNIKAQDIDYINLHGTGTAANDSMEANAVYNVFGNHTPVSSTKSLTGHCLGASAGIETALCIAMLDEKYNPQKYLLPHICNDTYDENLPKIRFVSPKEQSDRLKYCMCNAFGFGGSNAVIILGKCHG